MKSTIRLLLLSFSILHFPFSLLQAQTYDLVSRSWPASWITHPTASTKEYGVFHFRKNFELREKPGSFVVHVSADNRYRLFVNGQPVGSGPARGDLAHWHYETYDLAPHLKAGKNVLAALVWNMAEHAPVAQQTIATAFLMQGNSTAEAVVNTGVRNSGWKVAKNEAYTPCSTDNMPRLRTYMVIGPGDRVDAARFPWGWETPDFDDEAWPAARGYHHADPQGQGTDNLWTLLPRSIPMMEETPQRGLVVRRTAGLALPNGEFLAGGKTLTIPARSTVKILLDQTVETTAYPELTVSGGRGATVTLTYSEALYKTGSVSFRDKGNRNDIEGREIQGNFDQFLPDGGQNRRFRPLWFRTWRYLQLDVQTADEPLTVNDLSSSFTAYPFVEKASFSSSDPTLTDIWNVGWRTARLCANETYYDCPYYEQLQYEGDTRIQALISLYVSGDDRLVRKAIADFYHSRVSEGLTQGRYPSNRLQVIPPFSLYWCSMVYDYWMHRRDDAFVGQYLTAIRGVLDWYEKHTDPQKAMLGPMAWWNFEDWNRRWPNGTPHGATDGNSSVITLHYVYTLNQMAPLFEAFGEKYEADQFRATAARLGAATMKLCLDEKTGLIASTPARNQFSPHAAVMGVLSGAVPVARQAPMLRTVLATDSLTSQMTFYYRFYLNQALKKAGLADTYVAQLKPWRDMLAMGLTTFAENPEPTRSDCHAWSASPNYDLLATVCGIVPDAPGFARVRIAPALGELSRVSGKMPHPAGEIGVSFAKNGAKGLTGEVTLPAGLTGKLVWQGKEIPLKSGKQTVSL
jgi:hypothetical protein